MTIDCTAPPKEHAQGVLDSIAQNPDSFDMGNWLNCSSLKSTDSVNCGTTMCAAGWLAHNAGYDMARNTHGGRYLGFRQGIGFGKRLPEIGADLLALTEEQADDLFYSSKAYAIAVLRLIANGYAPEGSESLNAFLERHGHDVDELLVQDFDSDTSCCGGNCCG